MTAAGRELPDTDWHVPRLYDFASSIGASVIAAIYSRYVIDLNRAADDAALYPGQLSTGLCPAKTFAGEDIYRPDGAVDTAERAERIERYWRPYHEHLERTLDALRERHGYALLWDAHSIAGEVPALFDGVLPDLNVGTNGGKSAAPQLAEAVAQVARSSSLTYAHDGRFRGGYITRHYGKPGERVHAVQLEIAQRSYMDEGSRVLDERRTATLAGVVRDMLFAFMAAARGLASR